MKKSLLFLILGALVMGGCMNGDVPYNEADFAHGGEDAPLYNERTSTFMQADNKYSNIQTTNNYKLIKYSTVPTIIRSISSGVSPAFSIAFTAAFVAISVVYSLSALM